MRGYTGPLMPTDLKSAVLLIVFNRPGTTKAVLEAIREVKPPRMYIASDGPRPDRRGEEIEVENVRSLVAEGIDWDCEVKTLFRKENLGCRLAVSGAISWFFEQEEEGIILEDDCLPDRSFFFFCEDLLDRYRGDKRVMHVAGSCLVKDLPAEQSYFFSKYPAVWGWATWRDAWSDYSLTTNEFESVFEAFAGQFQTAEEEKYWRKTLKNYFDGGIDTWDYPWAFSIWRCQGLSIYPTKNLVRNIGFSSGATHTQAWKDYRGLGDAALDSMDSIVHPPVVEINQELDRRVFNESYRQPPKIVIGLKLLQRLVKNSVR